MEILIILLLILLNGVFSMSEIALVSSKKFRLESAANRGNRNARQALELANNPNTFLSTVQLGITLIGILTGIYSGDKITDDLTAIINRSAYLQPYAEPIAVTAIVIILTFLSIVFGELLPKRIGLLYPESIATFVARPMVLISLITRPFIWLLTRTNDLFLRIFGIREVKEKVTEEEIKAMVQHSSEVGEIREIEQQIVGRVFALGDRRIVELMTHRSNLVWLDIHDNLETLRQKVSTAVHSVYPVGDKELDNLIGILDLKELFPATLSGETFQLKDYVRQALIVHEFTSAYVLLERFREHRTHHAVVVDEYGSVQGMISMDDMLDALVGNISEKLEDEYQITKRDDASWLADGQFPYFEFLNYFLLSDLDHAEEEGIADTDFNTIGGLVLSRLGRIPVAGDKITWNQFVIEVVDMDALRIDKVLITLKGEE